MDAINGDVIVIFKDDNALNDNLTSSLNTRIRNKNRRFTRVRNIASKHKLLIKHNYDSLSDNSSKIFTHFHSNTKSTEELINELSSRSDVLAVAPNYRIHIKTISPNDKWYNAQWGLRSVNVVNAWDITTGSNDVYVVIADTGVRGSHEDLVDNFSETYSASYISSDESYMDYNGHGTHIAGIVGAAGDNKKGVVGVNWKTKIIAMKVMDSEGNGTTSELISAINDLMDILNSNETIKIAAINLSLGYYASYSPSIAKSRDPLWSVLRRLSITDRVVICVASGNEAVEVGVNTADGYCYPASFTGISNMIVVGASKTDTQFDTSYSNYSNKYVDISAPGTGIVSTYNDSDDSYASISGTSMATPFVTGVCALIKSKYPDTTASEIKSAIINSAQYKDKYTNYTKYGYLNAIGALNLLDNAPHITTNYLSNGSVGITYSVQLLASGSNISWSLGSNLPNGLTLDSSTGIISGTPTSSGSTNITIIVSNEYGSDSINLTLVIDEIGVIPIIITESLPLGATTIEYNYQIVADGSTPITWNVSSGSLPPELSLDYNTGIISGIPQTVGLYSFNISANNKFGNNIKNFIINIVNKNSLIAPNITSNNLPSVKIGKDYSFTFECTGSNDLTWSLVSNSALPLGLILSKNGELSGKAREAGIFKFTINVSNLVGSDSKEFTLVINPALMLVTRI